jgi:Transcriptional regulatory protein, C terminal
MTPKLEFCLLGPVVVRGGGTALPVPRGRQRAVLAVLLLNAGRAVSVSEIAETLWGPAPLPSASATVRNYVKRLRRALGDADQVPDGQLHVNLRGYDPGQPMSAGDALAGFLRSLGVAEQDIPAETEERAARYRSLLAGRRMLIMIDNAGDVEPVRRPSVAMCAGHVTCRRSAGRRGCERQRNR